MPEIVKTPKCVVCGSREWLALPDVSSRQSVTTVGVLLDEPLGKSQCSECGMVQRTRQEFLGNTDYYETKYKYYDRPGASKFDEVRYQALTNWMSETLGQISPSRVLDIGCGRGWAIMEMSKVYPTAKFVGVEPTLSEVEAAQQAGLDVRAMKIGEGQELNGQFDLVYSNNVLQHTTDPVAFLEANKDLLAKNGVILLSIPNGQNEHIELVMGDQNFAFAPIHIVKLAEKVGLRIVNWAPNPENGVLMHEQIFLMARTDELSALSTFEKYPKFDKGAEYKTRQSYLNSWCDVDEYLLESIKGYKTVYNFGGGLWSYVLAAYAPKYWAKIEKCTVDGATGHCMGKEVVPFENLNLADEDVIVLGGNPGLQNRLSVRFERDCVRNIKWNNIVSD